MTPAYVSYSAAYVKYVADAYPDYLRGIILGVLNQSGASEASALVRIWEPYRKPL